MSSQSCLPDWWLARYVLVFVMFAVVVALLVTVGVTASAALAVPVVLSGAAVGVLRRIRLFELPLRTA